MLRTAFQHGRDGALTRYGVKVATGIPTARVVSPGSGVRGAAGAGPASQIIGGVSKVMRPVGKALGYGALGLGALGAYGLHQQNKEDEEGRNLAYAPMTGGF